MGYLTDASYKQAQAEVYGQLTTSAVATGSQLVAFSGFSNSNYVREAYSADLDFGTGDWTASAWVKIPTTLPLSSFPVIGSELVVNGTFDTDTTGWNIRNSASVSVVNSELYVSNSAYYGGLFQTVNFTIGKTYKISCTARRGTTDIVFLALRTTDEVTDIGNTSTTSTSNTKLEFYHTASVASARLMIIGGATSGTLYADNISIVEIDTVTSIVDRNHTGGGSKLSVGVSIIGRLTATASDGVTTRTVTTDAAYNTGTWLKVRANYQAGKLAILVNGVEVKSTVGAPLLSLSSRYNLLTYTDQFDNAAWSKSNATIMANVVVAPDGVTTADGFVDNSANSFHQVFQSISGVAGAYTASVVAYAGFYNFVLVQIATDGTTKRYGVVVNLTTGTVTTTSSLGSPVATSNSVTSLGGGWYRISVSATNTSGNVHLTVSSVTSGTPTLNGFGLQEYVGSANTCFYIWGAQLETGSTAKTYQRVGAATDFDFKAPLTIGNNYAANAPFPGSIALLKFSATVPSTEQSIWMYEQEKQMFREGAQVTLPDANAIQDLAYDDLTDRWIAASTTNKSTWSGLVRTASEAVSAGSYTKVSAASGIQLAARSTTNPGVDITIPAYNVKARTKKKAEKSKKLTNATAIYDFIPVVFSNATLTNGSNVMTVTTANTSGTPYIGMGIAGTGIAAGTTIVGIVSGTPNSYYLSAAYTGTTGSTYTVGQSTFTLPVGYTAKLVYSGGLIQREGSTKAFTRAFDGFRETIVFGTSPGTSVVQIHAAKQ